MSGLFKEILSDHAIKALKSNKTKKEKEANYFLVAYGLGKAIHTTEKGKGALDNAAKGKGFKAATMYCRLFIYGYYSCFKNAEDMKDFLKITICETLQRDQDEMRPIFHEIKYIWEYDTVLSYLYLFGDIYNISGLGKRDKRKEYAKKQKFERGKKQAIDFLQKHNFPLDKIKKIEYEDKEKTHFFANYETTLKHSKELLSTELTEIWGTGKKRAKAIAKILEYI